MNGWKRYILKKAIKAGEKIGVFERTEQIEKVVPSDFDSEKIHVEKTTPSNTFKTSPYADRLLDDINQKDPQGPSLKEMEKFEKELHNAFLGKAKTPKRVLWNKYSISIGFDDMLNRYFITDKNLYFKGYQIPVGTLVDVDGNGTIIPEHELDSNGNIINFFNGIHKIKPDKVQTIRPLYNGILIEDDYHQVIDPKSFAQPRDPNGYLTDTPYGYCVRSSGLVDFLGYEVPSGTVVRVPKGSLDNSFFPCCRINIDKEVVGFYVLNMRGQIELVKPLKSGTTNTLHIPELKGNVFDEDLSDEVSDIVKNNETIKKLKVYCTDCKHFSLDTKCTLDNGDIPFYCCTHPLYGTQKPLDDDQDEVYKSKSRWLIDEKEYQKNNFLFERPNDCPLVTHPDYKKNETDNAAWIASGTAIPWATTGYTQPAVGTTGYKTYTSTGSTASGYLMSPYYSTCKDYSVWVDVTFEDGSEANICVPNAYARTDLKSSLDNCIDGLWEDIKTNKISYYNACVDDIVLNANDDRPTYIIKATVRE